PPPTLARHLEHRLLGVLRAEAHVFEERAVHDEERAFPQSQRLPAAQVEDLELVRRPEPEADPVGEADGAVVVEAGALPVLPRGGVLTSQVVLPTAPLRLGNAELAGDRAQPAELLAGALRVAVGVEARVVADLMAALVDRRDERAHPWVLEGVGAVARARLLGGQEVEGARDAVALTDAHQEIEGVVGVEAEVPPRQRRP